MAALMIINLDVTDEALMKEYRALAGPMLVGPGKAEAYAVSNATIDLGEGTAAGKTTVVLRYESVAAAQEAYQSEEYQKILPMRLDSTTPKIAMIVETLN